MAQYGIREQLLDALKSNTRESFSSLDCIPPTLFFAEASLWNPSSYSLNAGVGEIAPSQHQSVFSSRPSPFETWACMCWKMIERDGNV